jgi:predicted lactoylglutathione lyase
MAAIEFITLDVPDPTAAAGFYRDLGVGSFVHVRDAAQSSTGFRGFTLSLVVSQPSIVDAFIVAALDGGATTVKPTKKSFWGYGGVVRAPDGALWKVATSAKKDDGPAVRQFEDLVLLLGVEGVKASKKFYIEQGLTVKKSYGSKYVEFDAPPSHVKLALYGRRALAKDAGVAPEGTGSHGITIGNDQAPFTDPDGFAWQTVFSQTQTS